MYETTIMYVLGFSLSEEGSGNQRKVENKAIPSGLMREMISMVYYDTYTAVSDHYA